MWLKLCTITITSTYVCFYLSPGMLMIQGEGSAPTGPSGGSGGGGPAPKRLPKSKPKAKGKPSAGGGVTHEQPKKPEDLKAELRDLP